MLISNNNYSLPLFSSISAYFNPSYLLKMFTSKCSEVGRAALDELQEAKKDSDLRLVSDSVVTKTLSKPISELPKFKFFSELELPSSSWMSIERIDDKIQIQMPTRKKGIEEYKKVFKETNLLYVFHNTVKDKYLIGKTDCSFKKCCKEHLNDAVNYFDLKANQKVIDRQFLEDLNQNPENFQVALLYKQEEGEDLEALEISAIEAKRQTDVSDENKWQLYNPRGRGGGGRAHPKNQNVKYIIPKDITNYTPEKYFSYTNNKNHKIVIKQKKRLKILFNREVKKNLNFSTVDSLANKAFFYCIKNLKLTCQRYIGATSNPIVRAQQHGYNSLRVRIANKLIRKAKAHKGSLLHQTLARKTSHMAIGIFKNIRSEDILGKEKDFYIFTMALLTN